MAGTADPRAGATPSGWPEVLGTLLSRDDLSSDASSWAMDQIMTGSATPAQVAGFAVALRAKGEVPEEIFGLVRVMLAHAAPLAPVPDSVDTCGTGGDRSHTVNISTMAALVVAGAGVTVAKHGNRAASSSSGSADLLEALGVVIDLAPRGVARCVDEAGIGFCFAPVFHPSLRHAAVPRRELGVPTVFNVLGPLTNPARPMAQAVGCADLRLAPVMADVLALRGTTALVFRGEDGLDELTPTAVSRVWVVSDGRVVERALDPTELGVRRASLAELRGGDAAHNAAVARDVLAGARGAVRDAVVLNAAAALAAHEAARAGGGAVLRDDLPGALASGMTRAEEALDSGAATRVLERWIAVSLEAAAS